MADITKTIGTAEGRDYSTITLWEADLDEAAIYSSGDVAIGECYADSDFTENITINGGGTIGLAGIILRAATNEKHNGTAGTGVKVVGGITASIANVTFQYLDVQVSGRTTGLYCDFNSSNMIVQRCIVRNAANASGGVVGIYFGTGSSNPKIINTIIYDIECTQAGTGSAAGIQSASGTGGTASLIHNVTIDNVVNNNGTGLAVGISVRNLATSQVKNCIVTRTSGDAAGGARDYADTSSVTATNNLSSDTTVLGGNPLSEKTAANQFTSIVEGSEDYHLKEGADAIDTGALLGSDNEVNIDIDGYDRVANNELNWDMGADESMFGSDGGNSIVIGWANASWTGFSWNGDWFA